MKTCQNVVVFAGKTVHDLRAYSELCAFSLLRYASDDGWMYEAVKDGRRFYVQLAQDLTDLNESLFMTVGDYKRALSGYRLLVVLWEPPLRHARGINLIFRQEFSHQQLSNVLFCTSNGDDYRKGLEVNLATYTTEDFILAKLLDEFLLAGETPVALKTSA